MHKCAIGPRWAIYLRQVISEFLVSFSFISKPPCQIIVQFYISSWPLGLIREGFNEIIQIHLGAVKRFWLINDWIIYLFWGFDILWRLTFRKLEISVIIVFIIFQLVVLLHIFDDRIERSIIAIEEISTIGFFGHLVCFCLLEKCPVYCFVFL